MAVLIKLLQAARSFGYVSCQRWSLAVLFLLYGSLLLLTWALSWPLRSAPHRQQPIPLPKKEVKVHDLLEAVRIERDGEINKNFNKEVNALNTDQKKGDPKILLEVIFKKADTDGDKLLSLQELSTWISAKIQEHITQALDENFGLFTLIDNNPRNGVVSWDEYHSYFLKQKGLSDKYVESHDKKHKDLDRSLKEAIMRDRASWSEAARNDPDQLSLDEFLAFRHPESSHATILTLVEELFDKFDRDGDEQLTEEEFASLPTEPDNEEEGEQLRQGEQERRREFREVIDLDKNGKADRKELLMYIDPRNPRHAKEEAETLVALSDVDGDGHLSLAEVLNKMDLFLGSKMVDTARSFHDEF